MNLSRSRLLATSAAVLFVACSGSSSNIGPNDGGTSTGPLDGGSSSSNDSGGSGSSDSGGSAACGVNTATPCADGATCQSAEDCQSGSCRGGTCQAVSPADGAKDGDETDVDCGGTKAPACADTKGCKVPDDCTSSVCTGSLCQAPTHTDTVKNGDETGVDCGGPTAPNKCGADQGCVSNADCDKLACDVGKSSTCTAASHTDGVANDGETDVDCGGTAPNKCATTKLCAVDADCDNVLCAHAGGTPKTCDAPSFTDGLKNGNESDIDCGSSGTGTNDSAPACADINPTTTLISSCAANTDCKSAFCNTTKKQCVDGQSCAVPAPTKAVAIQDIATQATNKADAKGQANKAGVGEIAGIDSCGAGESTDATHTHDSCCKSLDVAVASEAKTVRIDKYEVTTGRIRQFVEAVKALEGDYNIQKWVTDQIASNTTAGKTMAAQFPTGTGTTTDTRTLFPTAIDGTLGLAIQLGATSIANNSPSGEQGCYMGNGQYAASTYWLSATDGDIVGSPPRAFTQDYYDIKPQNCITYWMAAAFCAWDGGALPTKAEYKAIWGTATYPWGADSRVYNSISASQPAGTANVDWTINNLNEQQSFYFYPASNGDTANSPSNPGTGPLGFKSILDTIDNGNDLTPYIAAPGRFTRDVTTLAATGVYAGDHWFDLAANMMEYEAIVNLAATPAAPHPPNFCDVSGQGDCTGLTACTGANKATGCIRGKNMPPVAWEGGSWEVHAVQQDGYGEPMYTQYGKAGLRCVRPAD